MSVAEAVIRISIPDVSSKAEHVKAEVAEALADAAEQISATVAYSILDKLQQRRHYSLGD